MREYRFRPGRRTTGGLTALVAAMAGALALATSALAVTPVSGPSAFTYDATSTSGTTVIIDGQIDAGGQTTNYAVAYDLASSTWCQNSGTSGSPAHTTPTQTLDPANDPQNGQVSVTLNGLTRGTAYCAAFTASNPSGSTTGDIVPFTAGAPTAITYGATPTGASAALVDGAVTPAGQSTTYEVKYDLSSSDFCTGQSTTPAHTTVAQSLAAQDTSSHDVSVDLTGLTPGAGYCAELSATNGSSTADGDQVSFVSGLPEASTDSATSTGASTAIVDGTVNPVGQATTYQVQYDVQSSDFCQGNSTTPAHTTPAQSLGATDDNPHNVSVDLTGLTGGQSYCAQVTATNGSGTGFGGEQDFISGAPSASTDGVQSTGASTATVTGTVNPVGQATTYLVQYDLQNSDFCKHITDTPAHATAPQSLNATDQSFHQVSVDLTGLTGGQSYCVQLTATNPSGTSPGGRIGFTEGVPRAGTFNAQSTGASTATVTGVVDPGGQDTSYQVQYDLASSTFCQGNSGTPAHTTPSQNLGATDNTTHTVSVDLTGLTAGQSYCAQLTATNPSGTAQGGLVSFTAGAPAVSTDDAEPTGASTATVTGQVNPDGQSTTYQVQYDLASSTFCQGNSATPAHTTSAQNLGATDSTWHQVSVDLTGLTGGQSYCAQLIATNPAGTVQGGQLNFTAGLPLASTDNATPAGVIQGTINPVGQATTYQVQYDLASSHWCQTSGAFGSPTSTTSSQSLGATDATWHNVSVTLTGLSSGQGYCAQLIANNGSGNAQGGIVNFTYGVPGVQTNDAQGTGPTTATVDGSVDPAGQPTTYQAQYAPANSAWCHSGGNSGSPTATTPAQSLGATDDSPHDVTVNLSGLTASTDYCAQLVASNNVGQGQGGVTDFTTSAQPVAQAPTATLTGFVSGLDTSSPSVRGTVNPNGQDTTYYLEYGTTTAYGSRTAAVDVGSGTSDVTVQPALSNAQPGTGYHYRLVATNATGTTDSLDGQLTTTGTAPGGTGTTGGQTAGGTTYNSNPGAPASQGSPGSSAGGNSPKTPAPSCSLASAGNHVLLRKPKKGKSKLKVGALTLTVRCDQSANVTLAGVLTKPGKAPKHGKAKPTKLNLGPVFGHVNPGAPTTLTIQVPAAALSALAAHAPESVAFTLTASNGNGASHASAGIGHLQGVTK